MHGLETIKKINENPDAYHASREPQHYGEGHHTSPEETQRVHGERVEARRRTNGQPFRSDLEGLLDPASTSRGFASKHDAILGGILADILGVPAKKTRHEQEIDDLFFTALLLDIIDNAVRTGNKPPAPMENIHSAIDAPPETPFFKFWAKLNKRLAETGYVEADYGQAKEAFNGGKTPDGSLTFVGKDWDGLRAVPAHPTNGKKTYHGEFRQVSDEGTVWRSVANGGGLPIAYGTAEAALHGARHAKLHSEKHG